MYERIENGMIVGEERHDPQARDEVCSLCCSECGAKLDYHDDVYVRHGEMIGCSYCREHAGLDDEDVEKYSVLEYISGFDCF